MGFGREVYKARRSIVRSARGWIARSFHGNVVTTAYGVRMRANWGDTTFEMCVGGQYGRVLSDLLRRWPEPFVFLDIGANQGLYALIAAANPLCAHAYAFEPVPATAALLADNIGVNGQRDRVTALAVGISDRDADLAISVKPGHSGVASLHHSVGNDTVPARVVTATSLAARILPAELPIIAKIDVEGHEAAVIASLLASPLAPRLSTIFYEVDEAWCAPDALSAPLAAIGFAFRRVGTGRHYDVLATRAIG